MEKCESCGNEIEKQSSEPGVCQKCFDEFLDGIDRVDDHMKYVLPIHIGGCL